MATLPVVLHPVPEALVQLGKIGRSTLYARIANGEIGTVKIGARIFIPSDEIAAFIERNRQARPDDAASAKDYNPNEMANAAETELAALGGGPNAAT